jgi:peptide/nickel transport system ATP-binding protein
MVFQDPYGSLNPSKKIGWLLKEPLRLHMVHTSPELLAKGIHVPARKYTRKEMDSRMELMLDSVGLNRDYAQRYPEELSGGERQRAAIAMALMLGQEVIVLDEPVSALDVTVEEKILELLVDLKDRFGLSYIFITHDMNVVSRLCDRVCVMYGGAIVEEGPADEVLKNPSDGYTKKLINAVLKL